MQPQPLEIHSLRHLINTTPIPAPTFNHVKLQIVLSNIDLTETPVIDDQTAVQKIIMKTCQVTGVSMTTLMNHRTRKRAYCFTRNLIVFFSRRYTKVSLKAIARYMWRGDGNPIDHSTIIHCHKVCQMDIEARCDKHNFYKNYLILAQVFDDFFTENKIYGAVDSK